MTDFKGWKNGEETFKVYFKTDIFQALLPSRFSYIRKTLKQIHWEKKLVLPKSSLPCKITLFCRGWTTPDSPSSDTPETRDLNKGNLAALLIVS